MKTRKFRKFTAAVLAAAFTLGAAVLPSSADGTLQIRPNAGNSSYEIRISGSVSGNVNLTAGTSTLQLDTAFMPNPAYSGGNPIIRSTINPSLTAQVKTVKDVRLNNASITTQTVNVGWFEGTNTIAAGTTTFTWSATIVLADASRHPITDLGFTQDVGGIEYLTSTGGQPTITFNNIGGSGTSQIVPLQNYRINEVRNASTSSPIPYNTNLSSAVYLGNGSRIDLNAATAIQNAAAFSVTLNFDRAATGSEVFLLATDLSGTSQQSVIAQSGARSATFTQVPKSYFFNTSDYAILGTSMPYFYYTFGWIRITSVSQGNLGLTGIDINYTGTSSPGTGTNNNNQQATGDLALNFNSITLNVGADQARIRADGYNSSDLKFSIASPGRNNDVITIYTSGRIWARKPGTATVNVRNSSGALGTVRVTVRNAPSRPITTFKFSGSGGNVFQGARYNLLASNNATVLPSNHNDIINWYTSDRSIATVDNGRMTVVGTGRVTITAVSGSGIQITRTFTAHAPDVVLSSTSGTVKVGQTLRINATARPSSDTIKYRSVSQAVATVSPAGIVTGVSPGTTQIEVYTDRGASRLFNVTVTR